jgi:Cys-rich repeat protein
VRINGVPCEDGDLCTVGDSCQGGTCRGGEAKSCAASDACHVAGVCLPQTGACTNPNAPDGTSCTDNDACTLADTCTNGVCGGNPMQCVDPNAPVCTNGNCNACTGHFGSSTPGACPSQQNPACLQIGSCVECTITGGNPNGNTTACTGNKPICNDATKKCVECTNDSHCPDGFCNLTNNQCVNGCQNDDNCPPSKPICDPDTKVCVPCTEDEHCEPGQVCENKVCVPVDGGAGDGGTDAGADSGTDAGITDGGTDGGDDAGLDGGLVAGDAGDAGDAGSDGGRDSGTDGGRDGGTDSDGGKIIDEEDPFVDEYGIFGAGCDCNQALSSAPESSNLGRAAILFGVALALVARRRRSNRAERRD